MNFVRCDDLKKVLLITLLAWVGAGGESKIKCGYQKLSSPHLPRDMEGLVLSVLREICIHTHRLRIHPVFIKIAMSYEH